ncbi:MAG: TPM domain-containing protein [Acutalibacteraceae bacterium]
MKRNLTAFLALLMLCFSLNISAFAAENTKYIADELDVLNQQEESDLNAYADYLNENTGVDFVFVSTSRADDLTDYALTLSLGKSDNKVVMVVNNEYWDMTLVGSVESVVSETAQDALGEAFNAENTYDTAVAAYMKKAASMFWPDEAGQIKDYATDGVPTGYTSRLVDNADLLNDGEETTLLAKLDEISERQRMDVVVVTVDSIGDKTPEAYADDFYDYNGYGIGGNHDGILLLVSMENRDWHITTTGYGITAFTDAGIKYLSKQFLDDLGDGNYAAAFTTYADKCDEFITQANTGEPYDVNNLPKEPFDFLMWILISVVVGLVAAYVITNIMKGKLKTVRFQPAASNYVKQGSLNLTNSQDIFLYTHVDRKVRPKETSSGGSSTHTSSSGSTHGGGGGKF